MATTKNTWSTGTAADEKRIWDYLMTKLKNAYGVAGLMGNLYAESALRSHNLQQTYEKSLKMTDTSYTNGVDNGTYTNFVNDKAGFGLVQWTYHSRKQGLLDYARSKRTSIADLQMQLDYLWKELGWYPKVLDTLKKAKSVKEASNVVLFYYESPADQGEAMQKKRADYGQVYYDKYATSSSQAAKEVYRVRKAWNDAKSEKGKYPFKKDAIANCPAGYTVYDSKGKVVYKAPTVTLVLEWQKAAIADGFKFPKYGADGKWGTECEGVAKKAVVKKQPIGYKYPNLTKFVQTQVGATVDGKCGSETRTKIAEYQKAHGLVMDGCAGVNTYKAMLGIK